MFIKTFRSLNCNIKKDIFKNKIRITFYSEPDKKALTTCKKCDIIIKYIKCLTKAFYSEGYRSGHNEAVLKTD